MVQWQTLRVVRFAHEHSEKELLNVDTIYLLPGEKRCVDFRDANGVPKVHYIYCSIRGRLLFTDMSEFQDGAT